LSPQYIIVHPAYFAAFRRLEAFDRIFTPAGLKAIWPGLKL